jgi:hypothetical protein
MFTNFVDSLRKRPISRIGGVDARVKFYFQCVQRADNICRPVESNVRQRNQGTMRSFNCKGSIIVLVSLQATAIASNFVGVLYNHAFHERKRRTKLSPKLKQMIQENMLLGARQIYAIFLNRIGEFPEDEGVTQGQVIAVLFISDAP